MRLYVVLAVVTLGVVVLLVTSERSGTGASDVGERVTRTSEPAPAAATATTTTATERDCRATESNPGGDNNYVEEAPAVESLGSGFVVTGLVRAATDCRPLEGVPVQVWLATETGGEQDNRATVMTGGDGRYRIETDPTINQFGEPNIHVAYDGDAYEQVFIRRVVDLDDTRATVDLTLAEQRG